MPEDKPVVDSERMRRRVTHGWAFRDLHVDVVQAVDAYIQDGDPQHLEATTYQPIRDGMYKRGER